MKTDNNAEIPFSLELFWAMIKKSDNSSNLSQIWLFLNRNGLHEENHPNDLNPLYRLCTGKRIISNWFFFLLGVFLMSLSVFIFGVKVRDESDAILASVMATFLSCILLILIFLNHLKDRRDVRDVEDRVERYYNFFAGGKISWSDKYPSIRIYNTLVKKTMETTESERHNLRPLFELAADLLREEINQVYRRVFRIIDSFNKDQVAEAEADVTLWRLVTDSLKDHSSS